MAITSAITDEYKQQFQDTASLSTLPEGGMDLNQTFDDLVGQATGIAKTYMTGELPQDVQDIVAEQAAQTAQDRGVGLGQKSRYITARDLGLTSLGLKSAGATMAESISKLTEARRQFDQTYSRDIQTLMLSQRKTDVLESQFNRQMTFNINELIANTVSSSLAARVTGAAQGIDMTNVEKNISDTIDDLNTLIGL
ncbi:hypothetical protein EOL73_00150 [Candidatus Saccharibacteria bacterium]|nr:hypothetical protein [Candidatus Saccharibacteria bacterium]